MSELEQPLQGEKAPAAKPDAGGDDPVGHLHKMSTTAGVGSQDYVAVNSVAVAALLMGFAGALMLVASSWILAIIPLAAAVMGAWALVQISQSNGTQTGRGLAVCGIVLAAACVGGKAYLDWQEKHQSADDVQAISDTFTKLGELVIAGKYSEAYALFSGRFQSQVTETQMEDRFKVLQVEPSLGKVVSVSGNGKVLFEAAEGTTIAKTMAMFQFEKAKEPWRMDAEMRFEDGKYVIDSLEMFAGIAPKGKESAPGTGQQ